MTAEFSVVPALRVPDMASAIEFYQGRLGFTLVRGGPDEENVALSLGNARIILDKVPTDFYSPGYNEAIEERLGNGSAIALYIEAPDIDAYYERIQDNGVAVIDPIDDRPWGQREFTIEDPYGNWLSFWEANTDE